MAALTVRVSRARYLRRRNAARGFTRGRLRRLIRWCDARADTAANGGIGDTGAAPVAVTADNLTELIAEVAHGFADGAGPMLFPSGTIPDGLDPDTPYFLWINTAGDYFLVRDRFQALAQQSAETFTTDGVAVTRVPGANAECFFAFLKAGTPPAVIQDATDIDNLIYT